MKVEEARAVLTDVCKFFEFVTGNKPYKYQEEFLKCNARYRAACWGRQTGKTTAIAVEILYKCIVKPKTYVRIYTPKQKLAERIYDNIDELIEENDFIKSHVTHKTRTKIIFDTPSRIEHSTTGLTGDQGRGYTPSDVYFDEASRIPDEAFFAIEPSIMRSRGSMTMISTPYGVGKFYDVRVDKDSPYKVFKVTAYDCPDYNKKDLERAKKENPDAIFRMEYLAEDVEETNNWFPKKLITKVKRDKTQEEEEILPEEGKTYILGVDFARMGEDSSVYAIAEVRENVCFVIKLVETKKTPMTECKRMIKHLHEEWDFYAIYIDTTPLGIGIYDELMEEEYPVIEATMQMKGKAEMFKQLKLLMEQDRISLPNHDKMEKQLISLVYTFNAFGLSLSAPPKGFDDFPDALALLAQHFVLNLDEGKQEDFFIKGN